MNILKIIPFLRCHGKVIRWGQEFYILPDELKEVIQQVVGKVFGVNREHGKGQLKNYLNELRNSKILRCEVLNC